MTRFSRHLAAVALVCFSAFSFAQSNDLQEISKLLRSGQHAQALDKVNQFLAGKPKDAQGRFLKGLILTEQNKTAEAIEILTALSKDFPELPEPYNNLAVLYASQGQYEKARQSLEQSIRTHPAYATAYENLGDVYTKLASQAYDKALQLDSSNTTAQTKLALVRDLVPSGTKPIKPTPAPAAPNVRAPEPAKAAPAPAVVAQAAAPAPAARPAVPEQKAATTPAPAAEAAPANDGSEEVIKTIKAWAKAWSAKDVAGYLAYYAGDFKTPNGEARSAWESERRRRINAGKNIEVVVDSPRIRINGATATATFRQSYRSDSLNVNSLKTLTLHHANGKWLILQERTGN
jgi:tetratricopeptide (TPR) repeat protein